MWSKFFTKFKEVGQSIISSKLFVWILVILGSYIIFSKVFAKDKFEEKDLPDSGGGLPKGWGTQEAKLLATEGNDVIDGLITLASTKEIWAAKLNVLTDDQLTLVYNAYNVTYGKANEETLTEAMNNEWNALGSSSNWQKVIGKLRGLKLY